MYSFRQETYEKWLAGLAAQLHVHLKDNTLSLPAHLGEGDLFAQDISAHLSFLLMDFRPEQDIEWMRQPGGRSGFTLSFSQPVPAGSEETATGSTETATGSAEAAKTTGGDIRLSDTRDALHVKIPAGTKIKRLELFCSEELIRQYLPAGLIGQLEGFAQHNGPSADNFFISLFHRETLKDIFNIPANDPLSAVKRISLIMRLAERFLNNFVQQERDPLPRKLKKNDLESMRHIEQILSSRLEGFPSLESLAHEVFMSTSKLKTLFKQVYGHTLYDYYNKNRLQRAKEMLVTGQYSIKQAGCEIGFSNLSHFAKAFKKEYGVLPRDMVRAR
jgi:AraC-like DNA-binding protein